MKSILLTGGCGYIASHTCLLLLNKGYKVYAIDSCINSSSKSLINVLRISNLLNIEKNIISIKATTNEKIGFIGNGEGIAAEAIVQISNENIN